MKHRATKLLIATGFLILISILFIDYPLSYRLRTILPDFVEVFKDITDFGLSQWYLYPSAFVSFIALFLWRVWKNKFGRILFIHASFIFTVIASSGIAVTILKALFARARPRELLRYDISGFFYWPEIFQGHLSDYNSFPSGHTTTMMALGFALTFLLPQRYAQWSMVIMAVAIIIALSRIIIGAHYLSDVIAGCLVAIICSHICRDYYLKKFPEFPKNNF